MNSPPLAHRRSREWQVVTGRDRRLYGVHRDIAVAQPAAGADWSITVPGGVEWWPIQIFALFTTSAAVATRLFTNTLSSPRGVAHLSSWTNGVTASHTVNVTWYPSANPGGSVGSLHWILRVPYIRWRPAWTFRTVTTAIQAGDQWSAIILRVNQHDVED